MHAIATSSTPSTGANSAFLVVHCVFWSCQCLCIRAMVSKHVLESHVLLTNNHGAYMGIQDAHSNHGKQTRLASHVLLT